MNNLKAIRIEHGWSQKQLADALNVSQSSISEMESGRTQIDNDKLRKISGLFNVSIDEILGNKILNILPITTKSIPMLGEIAAGEPIYMVKEYNAMFPAENGIKADFCLRVKGNSMINAGIRDGAIVFIKEQPMVENGEIACVSIDDEATLKRVYFHPDHNILQAENPKYAPIIIFPKDNRQIRILGKAISYQDIVR